MRGAYAEAVANFTEAIRLQPDFGLTNYNHGYLRSVRGDHAGAVADYTETLRLEPGYA